jgi:hypothetical protein
MASAGTSAEAFRMDSIALYLPEVAMKERGPSVDELVAFIKALVAKANDALEAKPKGRGASGALVVALKPPARSRIWIMVGDEAREAEFVGLLKPPLEAVPSPSVSGYNAFAINFSAWGGGGPPVAGPLPLPKEWRDAMGTAGGRLPDDVLKVLWPD